MKRCLQTLIGAAVLLAAAGEGQAATITLPVVNGGFETDTAPAEGATGWTIDTGGTNTEFWTTDGTNLSSIDPTGGQGGSEKFLTANRLATNPDTTSNPNLSEAYQDIDLTPWDSNIDGVGATVDVSFYYAAADANDAASASIEFYDGSNQALGSLLTGTLTLTSNNSWSSVYTIGGGDVAVPVGTRTLRIALQAKRGNGTATNVHFDNVSAGCHAC